MDAEPSTAFSNASTQALVGTVKSIQRNGKKGSKGAWKDFLDDYDLKLGSTLSDPAKRSRDTLISFLCTFTNPNDVQFIETVLSGHSNREAVDRILKVSEENKSCEQDLVRLTRQDRLFPFRYVFPYEKDWVIKNVCEKFMKDQTDLFAIDCEMVLCEDGTDALVKVCVVDRNLQVKLDKLVDPCKPVADYRTDITGVTAEDLDSVSCTLATVQKKLKKLMTKQSILIGHSLYNDLIALKFDYAMVIDTSLIFKTVDGSTPSLSELCKFHLGYQLRKDGCPHDCKEDAQAAMKLVLYKIEQGVDKKLPLVEREVKHLPESEMAKLLIHRIPVEVSIEEVRRIFPEKLAVELKPQKKNGAIYYSVYALFSDAQESLSAFKGANGKVERDNQGLLQKLVTFQCKSGSDVSVYVRKMGLQSVVSEKGQKNKKRTLDDDSGNEEKKVPRKSKTKKKAKQKSIFG